MSFPLDAVRIPLRVPADLTRIADAVTVLPQIARLLRDVNDDVRGLREEIDGLTASLKAMEGKLDGIQKGIDPLDDDLSSVQRGVHALPPKMDQMAAELSALRADLSSVTFVGRDS